MDEIENQTQQNPVQVVEQAIQNATPSTLVKSKRVRGSTFQTPNTLDPTTWSFPSLSVGFYNLHVRVLEKEWYLN